MKISFVIFFLIILSYLSCEKLESNYTPDCSGITKSFVKDVNPIIISSCATNAECHGNNSSKSPGPLTSYSRVYSAKTLIREVIAGGVTPKHNFLSNAQKDAILCWIDNGALNN